VGVTRRALACRRLRDSQVIGALTVVVSLAGAANPSFWFDEAATISAASSRSLPDLMAMLCSLDAVHGLYYLLMHGWFAVFPHTEFWSRVPSGLAVGAAAAGVVVLAAQLSTRSASICSGVVFAILPRATWAGIEARPYAMSAMASVWVLVILVLAMRRDSRRLWVLYTTTMLVSVALEVYLLLMLPVHALIVAMLRRGRHDYRRFALATTLTLVLAAPFLVIAHRQIGQLNWIEPLNMRTFLDLGLKQYFDESVGFGVAAIVIIGVAVAIRRWTATDLDYSNLAVIAAAWIAIPTTVLVGYSLLVTPAYYPRYLSFTAPAMALLIGTCITAVLRSPPRIAMCLVFLTLAATPNYLVKQRGPYAKYGMDYSQVADVIAAHAAPGDCLLLDDTVTWSQPKPIRPLLAARPEAYRDLVDVGLWHTATSTNTMWDTNLAPFAVKDKIAKCSVIWTVSERDPGRPEREEGAALPPGPRFAQANAYWVPHDLGFRLVERWQFNIAEVLKSVR
jgi:mannosyltransferase